MRAGTIICIIFIIALYAFLFPKGLFGDSLLVLQLVKNFILVFKYPQNEPDKKPAITEIANAITPMI
jgi:hypothetical protein